MSAKKRRRVSVLCVAVGGLFGGIASAQTRRRAPPPASLPPNGPRPAAHGRPASGGRRRAGQPQTPARADTASLMHKSGGSLLQATLASAGPGPGPARDVSFFGVPEPEPRTIKKHDLVTIIVREESEFSSKGTADLKTRDRHRGQARGVDQAEAQQLRDPGRRRGPNPPSIKFNGNREFKGEGQVDRTDNLTARITGEVLDVKPNGTLVLQARKQIRTDEEEQQFILTGICRAEDVNADNTILSTQLLRPAAPEEQQGAVRDATKRGWFPNFLDAVTPF